MRNIPFTQYLRPDGRRQEISIQVSDELGDLADGVLSDDRYAFEAEVLTDGSVSITCADQQEQEDIAISICPNAPDKVRNSVEAVIRAAATIWGGRHAS